LETFHYSPGMFLGLVPCLRAGGGAGGASARGQGDGDPVGLSSCGGGARVLSTGCCGKWTGACLSSGEEGRFEGAESDGVDSWNVLDGV